MPWPRHFVTIEWSLAHLPLAGLHSVRCLMLQWLGFRMIVFRQESPEFRQDPHGYCRKSLSRWDSDCCRSPVSCDLYRSFSQVSNALRAKRSIRCWVSPLRYSSCPVILPIWTPAHGIATHEDVCAHGHEDPAHRYSPLLEGINEVQNTRGTEIMFDCLDQPIGYGYFLVRTKEVCPSRKMSLVHNSTLVLGALFVLAGLLHLIKNKSLNWRGQVW